MRTRSTVSSRPKNSQNGISFIQVAEGSFQQLNDIMQRIRSLAVQSANGIYSNSDRTQIQVEVSQLVDEIDRISTSAEFNRLKMLTGAFQGRVRLPACSSRWAQTATRESGFILPP